MQEPVTTKASASLGSKWQVTAKPSVPSGHRSSPSREAEGHAEPLRLASEVPELQDQTGNAPASWFASQDALKAHHGAAYAAEECSAQELPPQGHHGFTSPFAFRHPPTSPRAHQQEADIMMTPDFRGLLQIAPIATKGSDGQDLTGDQHLTAQPLSQRETHATHLVQPTTAVPAAMVSPQSAAPTYFQRDAPVERPPSQYGVAEPEGVDRALSPSQQLQGLWANESGGAVQHPTIAQKPSLSSGWGQENSAPQQQQGSDEKAHIRSFQDIVGRGPPEQRPAETLNLPHLKVMESFLQRHEQEQGRLQSYSPLQSGDSFPTPALCCIKSSQLITAMFNAPAAWLRWTSSQIHCNNITNREPRAQAHHGFLSIDCLREINEISCPDASTLSRIDQKQHTNIY